MKRIKFGYKTLKRDILFMDIISKEVNVRIEMGNSL